MNPTILSVLSAFAAAVWSVWTWQSERRKERDSVRDEMSAQYVNTMMLVTQELQRRLYSILEGDELSHYRGHSSAGTSASPIAIDVLYNLSLFFGWGLITFVFGPYTRDPHMIAMMGQMGEILESRTRFPGDAFRFTITDRMALGHAVVKRVAESASRPLFVTMSRFEFEDEMVAEHNEHTRMFRSDNVRHSLAAIDRAVKGEALEGRERLGALQNLLVDLIQYLERKEGFCVSLGERKKSGQPDTQLDIVFIGDHHMRVVHHIPGRIRLEVPHIYAHKDCAPDLQSTLTSVHHVTGVRINANAGSVVIEYSSDAEPKALLEKLAAEIEKQFSHNGSRQRTRHPEMVRAQ